MRGTALALLSSAATGLVLGASFPLSAEVPDAVVLLDVVAPFAEGQAWGAAPPRFALYGDGQVFVGGTSRVAAGRLEKAESKAIEDQIALVRKLPGLGTSVTIAEGGPRYRLQVRKGKPLDLVVIGDPAGAPAALRPLSALLQSLSAFEHPSLRPYDPASYALSASGTDPELDTFDLTR